MIHNTDAVSLRQALALAALLLDFEAESVSLERGRGNAWYREVSQAAVIVRRLATVCDRLHAGKVG